MNIASKEVAMLTELIKLADKMDRNGDFDSAEKIDGIINSISQSNSKDQEMLGSVLSLADDLDANGLDSFADKIQSILEKRAGGDEDEEDEASEVLKMSLKDLCKKLSEDGLNSAALSVGDWSVHLHRKDDEDSD
tara:strand:+ start:527 stop:931 length:405 start_codon:yes stop_codon:yes gene_type:complete